MKRCPTCGQTFTDPNLSFCIHDGTPLAAVPDSQEDVTVVSPSARSDNETQVDREPPQTESYTPRDWTGPAYLPPNSYQQQTGPKKKVWPWVVGLLAALFIGVAGLGIAAVIVLPKLIRPAVNRNRDIDNANINRVDNSNLNANTNSNSEENANSANVNANDETATTPPTDHDDVLSVLTDLEHQWTVANINADKKALDKILADDYVGTTADGQALGKAEYIRTIERDTTTQKWDFEDLKLLLKGSRATLSGVVKFQTRDGERSFRFTDKFVWRDGRWQATGSEISPI
jgi:Domain of unknown function (DUF4440)